MNNDDQILILFGGPAGLTAAPDNRATPYHRIYLAISLSKALATDLPAGPEASI